MEAKRRLSTWTLLQVCLRSFFLQAAWNFERMQNLGWAFCMLPVLKRLYEDEAERTQALRRHLEFFNTHPYLAGPILGYAIRVEEKVAAKDGASAAEVTALKMGMMGTLAALGDNFFWATLRPLAALLGISLFFLEGGGKAAAVMGLAIFLLSFNLPHLLIRFAGLFKGYFVGPEIVTFLRRINVQRLVAGMQVAGMVFVGALFASFPELAHLKQSGSPELPEALFYLLFGAIFFYLLRRKINPTRIFLAVLALCLLAGFLHQAIFWRKP